MRTPLLRTSAESRAIAIRVNIGLRAPAIEGLCQLCEGGNHIEGNRVRDRPNPLIPPGG